MVHQEQVLDAISPEAKESWLLDDTLQQSGKRLFSALSSSCYLRMYLCSSGRRQPALQLKKCCSVMPGTFVLIRAPKIRL